MIWTILAPEGIRGMHFEFKSDYQPAAMLLAETISDRFECSVLVCRGDTIVASYYEGVQTNER